MSELNPEDRYQLRKLQMDVDKRGLESQKAQQDLARLVLELEHKYGLIGETKTIDPRAATIEGPMPTGNGNRNNHTEALLGAVVEDPSR